MIIKDEIEKYIPFNEQEEKDKELFLKYINQFDDVLTRNNEFGHLTASAFVLNKEHTKMLVVYHNIYDGWIYPGGHADGEEDLLSVALREVEEETNLKATVLDNKIYAIQSLSVKGHIKRGSYVPAHTHLDVVYIMEADETLKLVYREDESKGVKWMPLEDVDDNTVVDFMRPVHRKLVRKLESKE